MRSESFGFSFTKRTSPLCSSRSLFFRVVSTERSQIPEHNAAQVWLGFKRLIALCRDRNAIVWVFCDSREGDVQKKRRVWKTKEKLLSAVTNAADEDWLLSQLSQVFLSIKADDINGTNLNDKTKSQVAAFHLSLGLANVSWRGGEKFAQKSGFAAKMPSLPFNHNTKLYHRASA